MRSSWITPGAPSPVANVLIKGKVGGDWRHPEKPREGGGRGWGDAVTSHRGPGAT